jgi:thioredoxin reductase
MSSTRSIVVLGAGPAGLSAALWLRNLGFDPCVVETDFRAGGLQNLNFLANDWVLGQTGQTGPMLAARFVDHAAAAGVTVLTGRRLMALVGGPGAFRLRLDRDGEIACMAVVVATGTRFRAEEVLADIDGIAQVAAGRIAYGPYAFADLDALDSRRVLIIGGGDNAFENARLLAPTAAMVHVAVRSFPRAQLGLAAAVASAAAAGRCRVLEAAVLRVLRETESGLEATFTVGAGIESIFVDRVHVLTGYEPNTAFMARVFPEEIKASMRFDHQGYLVVDTAGRTGAPGIYAAGDVCNPHFPSVVSAIAQGALVAKTIEIDHRAS